MEEPWPYPFIIFMRFARPPARNLRDLIEEVTGNNAKFLITDGADKTLIGVLWQGTANELWAALGKRGAMDGVYETMIIAAADDWACQRDKPAEGWFRRNLGDPKF